mmetsp:Transcript_5728/g.14558  ORF Transcript_5728/g.14558 Transcript_5728/m.14558 type:complete len:160 (+) Transcript_5728:96-575(+)|eukprot:CAMPEP_0177663528 /NCGR_PEP_ID=MMETSP0447-20121125/19965_1 /TAXON_ID=0 /ORGANISM="Stygamoeba regulata, Strain BSH-02190019" /LENGTH=159 /DNA_ID=CAMNT_0019169353 /DNA_START=76 /DNA_END=555 /DNA_ORIENTATION=+
MALVRKLTADLLRPQLVNGVWRKPALSPRKYATLRKKALASGAEWEEVHPKYLRRMVHAPGAVGEDARARLAAIEGQEAVDAVPLSRWELFSRKPKGHRYERLKIEREKTIAKNMAKMPEMIRKYKEKSRKDRIPKKEGLDFLVPGPRFRAHEQVRRLA